MSITLRREGVMGTSSKNSTMHKNWKRIGANKKKFYPNWIDYKFKI